MAANKRQQRDDPSGVCQASAGDRPLPNDKIEKTLKLLRQPKFLAENLGTGPGGVVQSDLVFSTKIVGAASGSKPAPAAGSSQDRQRFAVNFPYSSGSLYRSLRGSSDVAFKLVNACEMLNGIYASCDQLYCQARCIHSLQLYRILLEFERQKIADQMAARKLSLSGDACGKRSKANLHSRRMAYNVRFDCGEIHRGVELAKQRYAQTERYLAAFMRQRDDAAYAGLTEGVRNAPVLGGRLSNCMGHVMNSILRKPISSAADARARGTPPRATSAPEDGVADVLWRGDCLLMKRCCEHPDSSPPVDQCQFCFMAHNVDLKRVASIVDVLEGSDRRYHAITAKARGTIRAISSWVGAHAAASGGDEREAMPDPESLYLCKLDVIDNMDAAFKRVIEMVEPSVSMAGFDECIDHVLNFHPSKRRFDRELQLSALAGRAVSRASSSSSSSSTPSPSSSSGLPTLDLSGEVQLQHELRNASGAESMRNLCVRLIERLESNYIFTLSNIDSRPSAAGKRGRRRAARKSQGGAGKGARASSSRACPAHRKGCRCQEASAREDKFSMGRRLCATVQRSLDRLSKSFGGDQLMANFVLSEIPLFAKADELLAEEQEERKTSKCGSAQSSSDDSDSDDDSTSDDSDEEQEDGDDQEERGGEKEDGGRASTKQGKGARGKVTSVEASEMLFSAVCPDLSRHSTIENSVKMLYTSTLPLEMLYVPSSAPVVADPRMLDFSIRCWRDASKRLRRRFLREWAHPCRIAYSEDLVPVLRYAFGWDSGLASAMSFYEEKEHPESEGRFVLSLDLSHHFDALVADDAGLFMSNYRCLRLETPQAPNDEGQSHPGFNFFTTQALQASWCLLRKCFLESIVSRWFEACSHALSRVHQQELIDEEEQQQQERKRNRRKPARKRAAVRRSAPKPVASRAKGKRKRAPVCKKPSSAISGGATQQQPPSSAPAPKPSPATSAAQEPAVKIDPADEESGSDHGQEEDEEQAEPQKELAAQQPEENNKKEMSASESAKTGSKMSSGLSDMLAAVGESVAYDLVASVLRCNACERRPCSVMLQPCAHLALCSLCRARTCPICSRRVKSTQRVEFASRWVKTAQCVEFDPRWVGKRCMQPTDALRERYAHV